MSQNYLKVQKLATPSTSGNRGEDGRDSRIEIVIKFKKA